MQFLTILAWLIASLALLATLALYGALLRKAGGLTADRELLALEKPGDLESYPLVSILVPVRNEARNIGACLQKILQLDYPHFEILVADDGSTDQTAAIVREMIPQAGGCIRLVDPDSPMASELAMPLSDPQTGGSSGCSLQSQPAPTDYMGADAGSAWPAPPVIPRGEWVSGKGFVLWQAARQARGEWLLCLDADTRLHPDALWRAMAFARLHGLKAFSGSGIYPNPSFWGELLEGVIYISVFFSIPLRRVHDPSQPVGWMNGQFMLFEQAAYATIGGHQAIRQHAQDDLAMGNYLKQQHVPYCFLPAAQLYECLNYVTLAETMQGWSRLLAAGTPWLGIGKGYFALSMAALALTAILPFGLAIPAWAGWVPGLGVVLGIQVGLAVLLSALNRFSMKIPVWRAVLLPIGAILAWLVYLQGYRIRFGGGTYELRGRHLKPDAGASE